MSYLDEDEYEELTRLLQNTSPVGSPEWQERLDAALALSEESWGSPPTLPGQGTSPWDQPAPDAGSEESEP